MLLKKIVLAEDDDAVAHLVGASLGDAGFLCLRARDGEEALTLVRREVPDLLILDVMMPKVDGLEVARRLKADVLASRIPILMLTAMAAVSDRVKGLDAGADDYLAKPFDLRELAARVRALIRASKRERERNPTTNLPGATAVEEHIDGLLKRKRPCTLLQIDVNHFDTYADAYGFHRADVVVRELSEIVVDQTRASAAFVGHVGGDDFVVVVEGDAAALAAQMVAAFDARVGRWHDGAGAAEQMTPRMALSIAVVDVVAAGARTAEEVSRVLAQTKRASRKREGSNFVVWGPEK
jgi:diguanylate cyclase (GGDEF)-like protein